MVKCLTIVDDATHEAVAIVPQRAIGGYSLTRILNRLGVACGLPKVNRTDNGKEFCTLKRIATQSGGVESMEDKTRMKKFLVFLGVTLLVLFAIGIARLITVPLKENAPGMENRQVAHVANPPASLPCGSGLAAQDLAGVCRSKPNPTPGALEAIGELRPKEMKIQSKSPSKKVS